MDGPDSLVQGRVFPERLTLSLGHRLHQLCSFNAETLSSLRPNYNPHLPCLWAQCINHIEVAGHEPHLAM